MGMAYPFSKNKLAVEKTFIQVITGQLRKVQFAFAPRNGVNNKKNALFQEDIGVKKAKVVLKFPEIKNYPTFAMQKSGSICVVTGTRTGLQPRKKKC